MSGALSLMTATWSVEIVVEWATVVLQKGQRGEVSRQLIRHLEGGRGRRRKREGEMTFCSIEMKYNGY